MSSTCARCRYPLTIDDSAVCYECNSCFHIDCAQLVGDPFNVLSSDHRNTFHCTTCELLPLPRTRSPPDSDDGEDMPSRQLDYPLSVPDDLAKEVHQVRGSVQDLHDICKDIFREINELKSINLTLRCCVENLKHDNEERDGVIAELKRRLDLLEKKDSVSGEDGNQAASAKSRKHVRIQEPIELTALNYEHKTGKEILEQQDSVSSDCTLSLKEDIQDFESEDEVSEWGKKDVENAFWTADEKSESENTETLEEKTDKSAYEAVKAQVISETGSSQHDWTWKGSDAVEVKEDDKRNKRGGDEYDSGEDTEEEGAYGWDTLEDEISPKTTRHKRDVQEEDANNLLIASANEQQVEEKEEENLREKDFYKSEKWEDEDEGHSEEEEEILQSIRIPENEKTEESTQGEEKIPREGEEAKESPEDGSEERKLPDGVEGGITTEGAEVVTSEPRLEGEVPTGGESGEADNLRNHGDALAEGEQLGESEARLEGDVVQGEPGAEGEERLKEGEAGAEETALPQEPHHTEEDLWTYLKETVTSVHPSTVEEFVQNLIGTLQHVPEEYLKPVIDANIKRANSPSITDGEHLSTPEGANPEGEPLPEPSSPPEDGAPSADTNTEVTENTPLENPPPVEEESAFPSNPESSALPEGPTIPETRTEEAEAEAKSYTALEDDI